MYATVRNSRNLTQNVDYITSPKPKNDDKYIQGKRALEIASVNGSPIPHEFVEEQDHQFVRQGTPKDVKHVIKTMIMFDPKKFDYKNLKDRKIALKIGRDYAKKAYPNNASLIVLQADNPKHHLHLHIATNARNMITGKSSTHDADIRTQIPIIHKVMINNGVKPTDKTITYKSSIRGPMAKIPKRDDLNRAMLGAASHSKKSWVAEMQDEITDSLKGTKSIKEFHQKLLKHNIITMKPLRMARHRGQGRTLHYYRHSSQKNKQLDIKLTPKVIHLFKKALPSNITKGIDKHVNQYVRSRKHGLLFYGGGHIISGTKLGPSFTPKSINAQISWNAMPQSTREIIPRLHKATKIQDGINQKKYWYCNKSISRKSSYMRIKQRVPEYHPIILRKAFKKHPIPRPMPKMHISTNNALNKLVKAMEMSSYGKKREEAIEEAKENYADAKQKQAIIYASNVSAYQVAKQDNIDIDKQVKQDNLALKQEINKEHYQQQQSSDNGIGGNGIGSDITPNNYGFGHSDWSI